MKQLVEFRINDGDREYAEFGIYDKKYSDEQIVNNFWFGDDPNIKDLENSLEQKIGMKVTIDNKKNNKGKITFEYKDLDQLTQLVANVKSKY